MVFKSGFLKVERGYDSGSHGKPSRVLHLAHPLWFVNLSY